MARRYAATDERAALRARLGQAKQELEARLWRGDAELRAAEARGEQRPNWEQVWLRLLARYTAVCDALAELDAAERAPARVYAA
jgi:hypothetical protein